MASHNLGYITASSYDAILSNGRSYKGMGAGGVTFARQLAQERSGICDLSKDNKFEGNFATEWGNENEADAIKAYEAFKFVEVTDSQKNITKGWLSCTPDGYVGEDGLVEIKCPSTMKNHYENIQREVFVDQYYKQCQFQLYLSGRKWCDLVSFDPRYKDPFKIKVVRILPDLELHQLITDRVELVEEIIKEELKNLENYAN